MKNLLPCTQLSGVEKETKKDEEREEEIKKEA